MSAPRPTGPRAGLLVTLILGAAVTAAEPAAPYFDARQQRFDNAGPADDLPTAAEEPAEIRIGYFGPPDPNHPEYGRAWRAACRTVEEANRQQGYHGKPFRLIPAWSANPWGTGVRDLTRLAYRDRVWVIVGGIDGPTTHLAEQVVAKARLPLVSPLSTDKTVNLANVPWMFSLAPPDNAIAAVLAPAIVQTVGPERLVVLAANDHDSHLLAVELNKVLSRLQATPQRQFEFAPAAPDTHRLIAECLAVRPAAVVIVADGVTSAGLVQALRAAGYAGLIAGGPAMTRHVFWSVAGAASAPLLVPRLTVWPAAHAEAAVPPLEPAADYTEIQIHDAVWLVIRAIRAAGLSRAEIARQLRQLTPCRLTGGLVAWDGLGANCRPPSLGTAWHGQLQPWILPHTLVPAAAW